MKENPFVKLGSYHTIELAVQRKYTLSKSVWDSVSLERLENACDPAKRADLAAILMQEGLANICIITSTMTIVVSKIQVSIPRKRKGASSHDKSVTKFYEAVLQSLLRSLDFSIIKCVILASPGFTKDEFFDYMLQEATKRDLKVVFDNKTKFVRCHSHSGHKGALQEIFASTELVDKLQNVKATKEITALNRFYALLRDDEYRAVYGLKHVSTANQNQAIETLLISEDLFRSSDIAERQKYVALVDSVKENSGETLIFSSMHVSGEQLNLLTGLAAILRFPLPEIDDMIDSDEEISEEEDYVEEYVMPNQ